jgi:hypothetical protein
MPPRRRAPQRPTVQSREETMPSLMAILGLDASSFQAKLTHSQRYASEVGKSIGESLMHPMKEALGAFAVGMVIKGAFEAADHIKNLSREFRVSAETIQEWDIAARRVGMTAEDIGNALNRLKRARDKAVSSGSLGGFAEFQVPMAALKDATITTEQVLERMIEVAGGENITDAQDVAGMELMGKSGAKILSAFQALHDLGPVTLLKDEEVEKMHEAVEGFEELKRQAASLAGKAYIAATAAPKSLWQTIKDLVHYGLGGKEEAVFGAGQLASDGMTVVSETGGDKLHGPVSESMSAEKILEMRRLQAEIAEKIFQNSLKTLSAEEKRAQINAEIAKHMKASEKAFENADWIEGYKEKLKAEELRGELAGVTSPHRRLHPDANALQKIGAYAGPGDESNALLRSLEQHVRRIADRTPAPHRAAIGGF